MEEKGKQDERRKLLFKWRFAFMREEGLTSTQKVVMHTLGAYMDLDGRGCVLGHSRIARESSLARGTVIRTIQELAGRWLTVTNRRSACGDADTNEYCAVIPQGVVSQDDHLVSQDDQGGLTGRLGVVSRDDPTSKSTSTSNSIIGEYWSIYLELLGGIGRSPKLTDKRRKKLEALHREHLEQEPDPSARFRGICQAVLASDHHMSVRAYQMPESLFKSPERRENWYLEGGEARASEDGQRWADLTNGGEDA